MAGKADEPKRPAASRLAMMPPPGATPRQPPPEPVAVPTARDPGEVADSGRWPGVGEVIGGGLGGVAALTGMAASAPVPPISVQVMPRTEGDAKAGASLTELARASLAREAGRQAGALGFGADGEALADAGTVRLEISVQIEEMPPEKAAEAVAAIKAAAVAAAGRTVPEGITSPLEAAGAEGRTGWSLLLGYVGPTADAVRLAGDVLGNLGDAGLGVVAGVAVVRTLRKTLFRKTAPAEASPADGVMTVTVEFRTAAKPARDAPSVEAELKRLKDFAGGADGLAKLLDRVRV